MGRQHYTQIDGPTMKIILTLKDREIEDDDRQIMCGAPKVK